MAERTRIERLESKAIDAPHLARRRAPEPFNSVRRSGIKLSLLPKLELMGYLTIWLSKQIALHPTERFGIRVQT